MASMLTLLSLAPPLVVCVRSCSLNEATVSTSIEVLSMRSTAAESGS